MPTALDYEAARSGVAIMPMPWRRLISVTGEARGDFLQGMLSNEIQALKAGEGCRALLLDVKGKVQADLDLWVESETIVMACAAAVSATTLASLHKYVLATPVQFKDLDGEEGSLGLIGPEAGALLNSAAGEAPPEMPYGHARAEVAGADVRFARTAALPADGIEIQGTREALGEVRAALHELAGGELPTLDERTAEILRVESGQPRHGSELTGEQFPQEARLDDAISYEKGCYLGQETVARIHYRGDVNRVLVGLRLVEPAATGAGLFARERGVGEVTSAVVSPRLGPIGLGYVRREVAVADTELYIPMEDVEPLRARVADLPFPKEGE